MTDTAADGTVLAYRGVHFAYDGVPVLRDVSLEVGRGEYLYVIGPNGGGKTTLLKLALGLLVPTAGEVRVFGQPPEAVRPRTGYVPQHTHFDPRFPVTVGEVVLTGRLGRTSAAGPYRRDDREAAKRALADAGLSALAGRAFASLSGGQRQRTLIARALAGAPELLLLDEPENNLDQAAEWELFALLERLRERMTLVLVTHDLGFVPEGVNRVVCVREEVRVHPTRAITGEIIAEMYGGDMRMVRHDRHLVGREESR